MGFNARKAAQVIAFFAAQDESKRINVLKAIKLVYLADRESLSRFGFPILNEDRVSMPHGPVNSVTLDCIKGMYDLSETGWSEFLQDKENHSVAATKRFSREDLDELSEEDIECLEAVWCEFGSMDQWSLRDLTHDRRRVPEWEDPRGSSAPIPLERILSAVGAQEPDEQADLIRSFDRIDSIFGKIAAG